MGQENKTYISPFLSDRMWSALANIALASFYLFFVYTNIQTLVVGFKLSVILLLAFNSCLVVLALVRRSPKSVTSSSFDYIIAFCGTLSPLLFLGLPGSSDHVVLLAMQIVGILFSFAGVLSLNRSFGLVPADRGIVTTGMYKFVRHPLYTGYVVLCFSFVLQNFSMRNVVAFIAFMIFESLRLLIEENFLSQNKDYADYMKKVRWRIFPRIW